MKRIRGLALPPGLKPTSMAPCHAPEHVVTASENYTFGSVEVASCITQLWVVLKFRIPIESQSHLPKRTPSIILSPHVSTSLCLSPDRNYTPTRMGNEVNCHWLSTYYMSRTVFKGFTNTFSQIPPSRQPERRMRWFSPIHRLCTTTPGRGLGLAFSKPLEDP